MKSYTIEKIAKYNTISVLGSLQDLNGIPFNRADILVYYEAILKDLETGAMEKSCREFDKKTTAP